MKPANRIQTTWQKFSIGIISALAACLLTLTPPFAAADDRPVIEVNFSITGIMFDEDTSAAIQPEIEQMVSARAGLSLGYLRWIPSSSTTQETAQWNVSLNVETIPITTDDGETTSGFIGTLKHSGILNAKEYVFVQTEENETIYPLGRPISKEQTALVNDISSQLDKQLETLLKSQQVTVFLRNIPLADNVIADNSLVLVPVKKRDLRTEADSLLAVEFKHNQKSGLLNLETTDEVTEDGEYKGYVLAQVMKFSLVPVTINTPTYWDEKLSPIIDSAEDVKVFMLSYSPSLSGGLDTEGGIVNEPDVEGEMP